MLESRVFENAHTVHWRPHPTSRRGGRRPYQLRRCGRDFRDPMGWCRPCRLHRSTEPRDMLIELAELPPRRQLTELGQLTRRCHDQMSHLDRVPAVLRGAERCSQRYVADVSPRQLELACQEPEVDVIGQWHLGWKHLPPDPLALRHVWECEFDRVLHAPCERIVDVVCLVGCQDHDALVLLDPLE